MTAWTAAIGPRSWTALNYLGGAGVIVLGGFAGNAGGGAQVALFAGAAVLGAVQLTAQHRRERAAKEIAEETRTVTNNAISNAFTPLLGLVAELVAAPTTVEQDRLRSQIGLSVAYAASLAIGPDQGVRSCVFQVDDPDDPHVLTWAGVHAGRGDEPSSVFRTGTVRGDLALSMLRNDTFEFCRDTEADPPPGWEEGHPHQYRTFLAVPVRANRKPLGMLTVDSLTAGDLEPDRDKPILDVLAHILAVCDVQGRGR